MNEEDNVMDKDGKTKKRQGENTPAVRLGEEKGRVCKLHCL